MTDALQRRLEGAFVDAFDRAPSFTVRAPGRVNLIGEHTDYNDGFVLPCAIGVETRVAVRPRDDRRVRVVAADIGGETDAFVGGNAVPHADAGRWRDYVRGMVREVAAAGRLASGADLAIAGNIPRGAGLSSSASLQVAIGFALAGERPDPVEIALMAQRAENDFVGVRCGNMDQLASAASRAGAALLIDCRDRTLTPVPVPADVAIVIVQSGVVRGLVDGHYNRHRQACEAAAAALGIDALRDARGPDLARLEGEMQARARHIVTENERVLAAAAALGTDDLVTLGEQMRASHASMRDDFAITVPEIDRLAALANEAIGREGGARMTGGGFGGAVVAAMRREAVAGVVAALRRSYRTPDDREPEITVERPAAGAGRIA